MQNNCLTKSFFERDTVQVAQELLGKLLVHEIAGKRLSGYIVETEAYYGLADPASHAARGQTKRNAALFVPSGHAYVYLIYGLHTCLNIVAHPSDVPAGGVLIRALEPVDGIEVMKELRGTDKIKDLTNGPGKVGQALGITLADNRRNLTLPSSHLYVDAHKTLIFPAFKATPRVGITKNPHVLWRFIIPGNQWVSYPRS